MVLKELVMISREKASNLGKSKREDNKNQRDEVANPASSKPESDSEKDSQVKEEDVKPAKPVEATEAETRAEVSEGVDEEYSQRRSYGSKKRAKPTKRKVRSAPAGQRRNGRFSQATES